MMAPFKNGERGGKRASFDRICFQILCQKVAHFKGQEKPANKNKIKLTAVTKSTVDHLSLDELNLGHWAAIRALI